MLWREISASFWRTGPSRWTRPASSQTVNTPDCPRAPWSRSPVTEGNTATELESVTLQTNRDLTIIHKKNINLTVILQNITKDKSISNSVEQHKSGLESGDSTDIFTKLFL